MKPPSLYLVFGLLCIGGGWPLRGQTVQVEAARQAKSAQTRRVIASDDPSSPVRTTETESAFGVQELLREPEPPRPFRVFADISAFVTNNVALSRDHPRDDAFLLPTFGLSYRREVARGLEIQADAQYAAFRYNRFDDLDFDSLDVGLEADYHVDQFGGLDLFVRYNFNELLSDNDAFFQSHTLTLGGQKNVALSDTQAVYAGISVQGAISDPEVSERSELWGYGGYRWQATKHIDAGISYRYGLLRYDEQDRLDHNHSIATELNYKLCEYITVSARGYLGWNRSNRHVYEYEVGNLGGGINLRWRF